MYVEFNGSCLKQNKITLNHGKTINIYIAYDLKSPLNYNVNITFENCLSRAAKLTENTEINKENILDMVLDLMEKRTFSHPRGGGFGYDAIILGWDLSSSLHVDNKKKDILILGQGPTQGLDDITLAPEKMYSINVTATRKNMFRSAL